MWFFKKKIPNPDLKKFCVEAKQRGFLLVKGHVYRVSVLIPEWREFLKFGKRKRVGTIFGAKHYGDFYYGFIADGVIVTTIIPDLVGEK